MEHVKEKQKTIEQWVQEYYDDLFRWAKFKTSSASTAEDLVQEVFLAAYNGLNKFEKISSPKTWLFQILNFKIVDHFRAKGRNPIQFSAYEITERTDNLFDKHDTWINQTTQNHWDPFTGDMDEEMESHLSACVFVLPEDWKQLVFGKYYEGKKADQLCELHGITKSNYWQIIHRSKLFLKNCIEKMLKKSL